MLLAENGVHAYESAGEVVEAVGLVKRFGDVTAVDGVSFTIQRGEVFGLLGPNGAGKTTTISMISCLMEPTEGDVIVAGHSVRREPAAVKRVLGVVPQEIALYPTLTALENLTFWGRMYGLRGAALKGAVDDALELAGLSDRAKQRIETYSGGMKRRINIAAGVLHRPEVLLMDEPTVGIDPQSRNHILETVKRLNADGLTVVYTSHYMEEVETLCDRVAIVDHGRVIACGTKDELRRLVGDRDVVTIEAEGVDGALLERLREVPGVDAVNVTQADEAADAAGEAGVATDDEDDATCRSLEVLAREADAVLAAVVSVLNESGAKVRRLDVREPDLESVFLHLTGKSLRD